jgi:hypothetical protein
VFLDYFNENFIFLAKVLNSQNIAEHTKNYEAHNALTEHLDLKTINRRVYFVLCIDNLLQMLYIQPDIASYYLMLGNLIEAIKEGKISKPVARLIFWHLKEKNIFITPEFKNLIDSSLNPDN